MFLDVKKERPGVNKFRPLRGKLGIVKGQKVWAQGTNYPPNRVTRLPRPKFKIMLTQEHIVKLSKKVLKTLNVF